MKTLIIAAHLDDESISCGGIIQARVGNKHIVDVLALFGRKYNYGVGDQFGQEQVDCFKKACKLLGVNLCQQWGLEEGEPQKHGYYTLLKIVEDALLGMYDEVVIPSSTDLNQDHRWLHDVCKIALRSCHLLNVKRILQWHALEGLCPSSINYYVPMSGAQLATKLDAVNCYSRESRPAPHPRSRDKMIAYHTLVGSRCGEEFAEPFTLLYQKD